MNNKSLILCAAAIFLSVLLPISFLSMENGTNFSLKSLIVIFLMPLFFLSSIRHFWLLWLAVLVSAGLATRAGVDLNASLRLPFLIASFASLCGFFMVFIQRIHDERWLRLLTVGLLIQPLSIIIFQTAPSVEEFYLASPIPYSIFGFNPIGNVLSDEKSGGLLFDNGNWAISFIFSLACIYLILFEGLTRLTLVIICMVSIFLTGSKSTFLLMPIVGFVGLLLWSISRSRKETAKFLGFSLTALSIIGIALTPTAIVLLGVTVDTFSYRLSFWTLALQNVGDYLWLGGGGGYWLDLFLTQGDVRWWREGIPVHNSLLSMLMVAGIMPVTLILLFFVKIIRIVLRCIYSVHTTQCARVQILTFLGLLWVFLHSQVSNMSIFGDTSTMVLTSLLVSLCFQSIGYDSAAYGCLPFRPKQMNHVRKESVN